MKRTIWHILIAEPFLDLSSYVLRPEEFQNKFNVKNLLNRSKLLLRFSILLFLMNYPLSLLLKEIFYILWLQPSFTSLLQNTFFFLRSTAWGVLIGITMGTTISILLDLRLGLVFSVSLSLALGATEETTWIFARGLTLAIAFGLAGGLLEDINWRKKLIFGSMSSVV